MPWTIDDILQATGGELVAGHRDQVFEGVAIDSRRIRATEAFVAIRGAVHDGHRFIPEVVERGVRGLIVGRERIDDARRSDWTGSQPIACVAVADTLRALGDLAAYHRRRSRAAVVAITGSNGKTSTRRMTAGVLSRRFAVLEPLKNLNNQIGVPLTLFNLEPRHDWAVLELGTNTPGEIARLAEICTPDVGLITNIGPAHLEGLGSLEGVLAEKGSLLSGLAPGGRAVLNADDPRLRRLAERRSAATLLYGLAAEAGVRAEQIQETRHGLDFDLVAAGGRTAVHLPAYGRFMVHNALAAAAVGHLLGLSLEEIRIGLEDFSPVQGRMRVLTLKTGIHLIDDTYNANPASMEAAVATLRRLRGTDRGVLVVGDMRELGPDAPDLHRDLGRLAARSGIGKLLACGEFAAQVAAGAAEAGLPAVDVVAGSRAEIAEALLGELKTGDWVLVKGSRAMGMEAIVMAIQKWAERPNG
jgi:UDP-N-acetylmuramoyl-tripeptide--D-alanyl-D-alanine ligase